MFKAIVRVVFGFVLACLSAGLAGILFALGPQEVVGGDPDRLAKVLESIALTATHSAVFAAPFAFLSAAMSEWQAIRGFFYHVLVGIAIAMAGFAALYFGEAPSGGTIFNGYAATAYAGTGFVGGLIYWIFAGRHAGSASDFYEPTIGAAAAPKN